MLTTTELRTLLRAEGLRLSKRLGQNHLIDAYAIQRIVNAADLRPSETVIEIGAGLGALTEPLAAKAGRVLALEVDQGIHRVLAERLAGQRHVEVLHQDALQFPWHTVPGAVVVGAIPYHITSPILVALAAARSIGRAILVTQEEVARRLAAQPGTPAYGRLTVMAAYAWKIETVFRLPSGVFYPAPRVASTCLRLTPHAQPPVTVRDPATMFAVVAAGFGQRRKMLANAMEAAGMVPPGAGEGVLKQAGLPVHVRAERLSLAQFAAVANSLR